METCTAEQLTLNKITCESIELSLVRLMEKKPFDKITVTEIIRLAGVGRTTFYRNFRNKEQVLCQHINNLYHVFYRSGKMLSFGSSPDEVESFLLSRFQFVKEQRKFFSALHKQNMLHEVFSKIDDTMLLHINGITDTASPISPYRLAALSGSCSEIIRLWIENDFSESPEEMTQIFLAVFMLP